MINNLSIILASFEPQIGKNLSITEAQLNFIKKKRTESKKLSCS